MKYFTPDLYIRLQDLGNASNMLTALQDWERAAKSYDLHLQKILPELPRSLNRLVHDYLFHDADVLGMGDGGDTFFLLLQLEGPPNALVGLTYFLKGKPEIDKNALPAQICAPTPEWLHDEISTEPHYWANDAKTFVHDIQLSNGWQVKLRFTDIELRRYDALFPQFVETAAT